MHICLKRICSYNRNMVFDLFFSEIVHNSASLRGYVYSLKILV